MAQEAHELQDPLLYEKYLQALKRHGDPKAEHPQPSPGHVIRHCTNCGQRAMFRLDPEGMWYECLHCGHYA